MGATDGKTYFLRFGDIRQGSEVYEYSDRASLVRDVADGQYSADPASILFIDGESARDVSHEIALEAWEHLSDTWEEGDAVPAFIKRHVSDLEEIQERILDCRAEEDAHAHQLRRESREAVL